MCRVEHQKLRQVAALCKAEQSKSRKLSNEHIVNKAEQTSKFSEAKQSTQIKALPPQFLWGGALWAPHKNGGEESLAEYPS